MHTSLTPVLAFGMPNASELMIIMVLVFIFFGAGRLPDVLKQFGKGVKEFKDASDGVERKATKRSRDEDEEADDDEQAAFEEFKRQRAAKQIGKDTTRDVRPARPPEPAGDDADGDGDNDAYGSTPPARKKG